MRSDYSRTAPDTEPVTAPYGWHGRERDEPWGACGGGECEYDTGTWFPCLLHTRELGQLDPLPRRSV